MGRREEKSDVKGIRRNGERKKREWDGCAWEGGRKKVMGRLLDGMGIEKKGNGKGMPGKGRGKKCWGRVLDGMGREKTEWEGCAWEGERKKVMGR